MPAPPRTVDETRAIPWLADALVDVGAACASAVCVAPFVATVDRAVVEASAGRAPLGRALFSGACELLLRPHRFFVQPSLWMVAGVYAATYSAANLIDSACERLLNRTDENTTRIHGAAKLIGTTAVNMSAAITKDVMFARMFGATASGPMPKATIGLFALRDVLTIGAAFTLPKQLASLFSTTGIVEDKYATETAQMISPIAMQIPCSPVHLLALHHYNVRDVTPLQRIQGVWATLPQTTVARMCRMAPAFGIGGVMNTSLVHRGRDRNLREWFEKPRAATDADDASPSPPPLPPRRRRIMAAYAGMEAALDLLGDVDPAGLEHAGIGDVDDGMLLRRSSSSGVTDVLEPATSFNAAQVGYYPEVSELVERRLGLDDANPLSDLLGDSRDIGDADEDMFAKLQHLSSAMERDNAKLEDDAAK